MSRATPHNSDEDLIPIRSDERKRLLPLGVTSIYKHINQGELHAIRVGARTYLKRGDIRRFVETRPAVGPLN